MSSWYSFPRAHVRSFLVGVTSCKGRPPACYAGSKDLKRARTQILLQAHRS